jgi:hypothetical protein
MTSGTGGKIGIDRFDMLNPKVQRHGDVAVLTFRRFLPQTGIEMTDRRVTSASVNSEIRMNRKSLVRTQAVLTASRILHDIPGIELSSHNERLRTEDPAEATKVRGQAFDALDPEPSPQFVMQVRE